jgi:hypothetical protein
VSQSGATTLAGILLLLVGVVLTVPVVVVLAIGGVILVTQPSPFAVGPGAGNGPLVILVVLTCLLALAAAHIATGIGVFLQKEWARRIGMTIGAIGVFVALVLMLTEIQANNAPRFGVPLVLAVIAYAFTFLALARREPASA